jgi:F-type H+-transporting ATPase subunit a
MGELHISVAAEPVAHIGSFAITNSLLTTYVAIEVLLLMALWVQLSKTKNGILKTPALIEILVGGFYNFLHPILGKRTNMLFPLLMTFFLFIMIGNWVGLLPGVGSISLHHVPLFRAPAADLSTTLALALVSVIVTQYLSIKSLGIGTYLSKFFNFKNPINAFVGILELISEFAKLMSFSFRLFGNIFAGEVLLVVITFLVPLILPIPFLGLEVFVGFIQALVFTMLTTIFIVVATEHH